MARSPVVKRYPCTCETQSYHLSKQPPADQKVVAEYLRRLADEVEGGEIKQISFHVSRPA